MSKLRIAIDPLRLDEEWLDQPKQLHRMAEEAADGRKDVDHAKLKLDIVDAELARAVRKTPEMFGIDKVTETTISTAVTVQPAHKEAVEELNDARHRLGIAQAAVDALEHRKRALEKLVDLHGMSYFAEPSASSEHKDEVETTTKRRIRRKGVRNRGNEDG